MNTQNTLNISKLAQHLGVTRITLYNMIEDGRFPVKPIQDSKPRRWNLEDVEAWRFNHD